MIHVHSLIVNHGHLGLRLLDGTVIPLARNVSGQARVVQQTEVLVDVTYNGNCRIELTEYAPGLMVIHAR